MTHHPADVAGTRWDPAQYARFADHRLRPAIELLQRVMIAEPALVYDLGCGSGEVTALICQRWPSARIVGVDVSPQMIEKARQHSANIAWQLADIATWSADPGTDLIYANASLHWLPDHEHLIPRLMQYLSGGGVLAIQMPLSWDLPSHQLMRETLKDLGSNGTPLGGQALSESLARNWVKTTGFYHDILTRDSSRTDIWETSYQQVLGGRDPVYQWVEATGLRPVLNGLSDVEKKLFIPEYQARLRQAYPARSDGSVIYPFKRLFIVARAK